MQQFRCESAAPGFARIQSAAGCLSDNSAAFEEPLGHIPDPSSALNPQRFEMTMKASTHSMQNPERFNCFQQIAAHVGGMTLALVRHHPVHWTFHWRGICRAIASEAWFALSEAKRNHAKHC